jgi:hypothetical protein
MPTNPDRLIGDAECSARRIAGEASKLRRSRDARAAELLATEADGLRRQLMRIAQALRAEGSPPHAA